MLLRAFGSAALIAMLPVMFMVHQVSAHAGYAASNPAPDAVLQTAPAEVWVQFTEAVTPSSTLAVTNEAGGRVDRGDTHPDPANPARLVISLGPVMPGRYTVSYEVASQVDGHGSSDSFRFTIAGGAAAPTAGAPPAMPEPAPIAVPAAPSIPSDIAHTEDHDHDDVTTVRVLSDDAAGPVHSHMHVQRNADRLRFQIPVSNHLHGPINNLEVHIALPHGTSYLGSATDDGDRPRWDGATARYFVPWLAADGRLGPYNLDLRVNQPDHDHPHPTLAVQVWLRFQHDGEWMSYTSRLTIENPLEPGAGRGSPAGGAGH